MKQEPKAGVLGVAINLFFTEAPKGAPGQNIQSQNSTTNFPTKAANSSLLAACKRPNKRSNRHNDSEFPSPPDITGPSGAPTPHSPSNPNPGPESTESTITMGPTINSPAIKPSPTASRAHNNSVHRAERDESSF
ncbi:hypothetical protein NQZ68_028194 [Dissostichus eleginoides]|nr:hypothetical protein NQZ68_028194 [Dissostichus eleginoides]